MRGLALNRRLVLERAARAADGAGGLTGDWQTAGTLWADVSMRSAGASEAGSLGLSRVRWRIVVRGAPAGSSMRPRPGDRFREGERLFAVKAVAERDPAGRFLICHAEEVGAP